MKEFLPRYLKRRLGAALPFALCCGVFAATFALYRFPLKAVFYPALICAGLRFLFACFDMRRAYRRHRALSELVTVSAALMERALPAPETVEDADDQRIIALLRRECAAREALMTRRYADMVDYYTLWAHQIKTPIASMRLTLQNEDTPLSRRLTSDLLRVEQYTDMALAFLRLDSASSDYVIRECRLDGIVRSAVKKFSGEFIGRQLKLDYAPLDVKVLTDEKWLSFVIEQVLSNALKYTPSGGVSVYLAPGPALCIADTGVGIAPEDLPRVFDRGYTGYNGREDKRASGLGLWLCRRICGNLGHTIGVESRAGEGTVVRIGLERAELEVE